MHVHLPKPLYGWRAFVGEVGVVVLGVLIALGAQQAVNDRNERAQARDARRAIQNELATYQARLESRWGIRDCVARRLGEIQALLDGAGGGGRIATPKWVGRPQIWTLLTVRWDATSQSGRAALLPAEELADYGLMYAYMRNAYDDMILEQGDWARLRTLEHLHSLTPQMAFELNNSLQDARYRAWRINGQIADSRDLARRAKLPVLVNDVPGGGTRAACLPMAMPSDQAARLANPAAGEP
jgi:hypothetical protein